MSATAQQVSRARTILDNLKSQESEGQVVLFAEDEVTVLVGGFAHIFNIVYKDSEPIDTTKYAGSIELQRLGVIEKEHDFFNDYMGQGG